MRIIQSDGHLLPWNWMKWFSELSSEIPTIRRTLGWLYIGLVMGQLSRELDELTGISLKKPRSLSNPKNLNISPS